MRTLSLIACVPAWWATQGCVDPVQDFDAFTRRSHAGDTAGGDWNAPCVAPSAEQVSGDYLVSITVRKLAPGQPLVLRASLQAEPDGGGLLLTGTMVPLAAADRATPLPPPMNLDVTAIGADGRYTTASTALSAPAAANPLLCAQPMIGVVTLRGRWCKPAAGTEHVQTACAGLTGTLTAPLNVVLDDLDVSVVFQWISPAGPDPSAVTDCEKLTPADPPQCG